MRWKTWQRTLSADVIQFTSAGSSLQWWQSPPISNSEINLRSPLCNSFTYFHKITSRVTAMYLDSQLKILFSVLIFMCQMVRLFFFNSFQHYVLSSSDISMTCDICHPGECKRWQGCTCLSVAGAILWRHRTLSLDWQRSHPETVEPNWGQASQIWPVLGASCCRLHRWDFF